MRPGQGTENTKQDRAAWPGGGQLLTENQVAKYLNVSPRSLQGWRYQGGGPPYVAISARAVRYRVTDLDAWLQERIRMSTSDG